MKTKSKPRFALRTRKGVTRAVQCTKDPSGGYMFKSDKKKCGTKTYRNITLARQALNRLKKQEFGRKKRVTNGFGRRKAGRRKAGPRRRTKKYTVKKWWALVQDPDGEPNKIVKKRAYKINVDGYAHKFVRFGTGGLYDARFYILPEDTKLYNEKDVKSGKLRKHKIENRVLLATELIHVPSEQLLSKGLISSSTGRFLPSVTSARGKFSSDTYINNGASGITSPGLNSSTFFPTKIGNYHPSTRYSLGRDPTKYNQTMTKISEMQDLMKSHRRGSKRTDQYNPRLSMTYPGSAYKRIHGSNAEVPSIFSNSYGRRPMRRRTPTLLQKAKRYRPMSRFGYIPKRRVNYGFSRYF